MTDIKKILDHLNDEVREIAKTIPPVKPKRFQRKMKRIRYAIKRFFSWKKERA